MRFISNRPEERKMNKSHEATENKSETLGSCIGVKLSKDSQASLVTLFAPPSPWENAGYIHKALGVNFFGMVHGRTTFLFLVLPDVGLTAALSC
ncbi:hypothetical protein AYL99_11978 [Fonsecaea erecta]|uniref:Uncharacterized protein n=1 Tax=Fonsecaea erecta TaxID=1367422 RepID=A0A178Z2T4_9EURO|nr:hypothetical protein AYL99_11978 [Fonsecaea erecta]OAP53821.1 hypothetical protein AYL99_11978 [Fonsecaea erecta]